MGEPNDGGGELSLASKTEQSSIDSTDDPKLTLLAEELEVRKEIVETGRLRVSKQTRTREAFVDETLVRAGGSRKNTCGSPDFRDRPDPGPSLLTERDVAQDVTLHDEHAEVIRKVISDPKFVGEIHWADGAIEVVETAEHALANMTARIVEEVGLKKIGADHIETIRDKLRRQQVEIERIGPDGNVVQQPRTA